MSNLSKSMTIDGVFASEHIDTSGEILDVTGCDISSLQDGSGVLNWEHRGDSPADILGKITYAKKIFSEKDCSNERETAFWKQVKVPFVYGKAELFDGEGHAGAMAAAAIIRYYFNRKEPILARFSIEGTTLERNGNTLKRSIARKIACTIKPCNRSAYSGVVFDDGASLKQSEKEISKGAFYETQLVIEDPASQLVTALERLKEANALQKALDEAAPRLLEHYSRLPGLETIDPKQYGTNPHFGSNPEGGRKVSDPTNWVDRSYYYEAGTKPEGHFEGQNKYTVELPKEAKIYDLAHDPDKLIPQSTETFGAEPTVNRSLLERKIKEAGYHGYKHSGLGETMGSAVAVFHPMKPTNMQASEPVAKAITAGGMNAAPSQLTGGAALQREDISGGEYHKNRGRVMAAFRDWDRVTPIRKFLKFKLPDASDHYIDRFAGLVDDYQVKKAEELFWNLEKALALTASIKLFEGLMKAESPEAPEAPANQDGIYRVVKKGSPRQIARFSLQNGHFNTLEDHRGCFGSDCENGPLTESHHAAISKLVEDGHRIEHEDEVPAQSRGELYRIIIPEGDDVIMVRLDGNALTMLDGTPIPEGNVNAILDALAEGEIQMEPLQEGEAEVPVEKTEDLIPGGKAAGRPSSDFDPEQIKMGIAVEMEHTKDPKVAEEIARDHLAEDPKYYTKLKVKAVHKD